MRDTHIIRMIAKPAFPIKGCVVGYGMIAAMLFFIVFALRGVDMEFQRQ
jgi:hypothetical protein